MKAKPKKGRKLSAQQERSINLLRRAAGLIAAGHFSYCCSAILSANNCRSPDREYRLMRRLFKIGSPRATWSEFWWDHEEREPRIFALLLAAEVIRTNSQP